MIVPTYYEDAYIWWRHGADVPTYYTSWATKSTGRIEHALWATPFTFSSRPTRRGT